jgi:glycosyltransferase involved in cell wall biosynthesis
MTRILYHHRTRLEDAQGIHIGAMVEAFRDLGHEVDVVSLVESNGSPGGARSPSWSRLTQGVPDWFYEAMSLGYNVYGYRRLARAIAQHRPDLIYERYALNTLCGVWASRRFGIPLFVEVNAPLYREQSRLGRLTFRRFANRTERWVCSNSTRTIVVSGVMRDMLAAAGVPLDHMDVMPNGVDPKEFNPDVCGRAVRQRYGLAGKVVVGVVGWFRQWHGIDMLVETMHQGGLLEGQVRVLLVGDGPAYADVRRYAETHRLLDAIMFTGPVARADVPAHVAAMDVAVQPSATDYACPMKIIEYMAMARCIVAPNQPNIRELLDDRTTALLFVPGNREGLLAAVAEGVRDPTTRHQVGRRAYERLLDRQLLWRANARRVLDLLHKQSLK